MEDFAPEAIWTISRDQFFQGRIAAVVGLPVTLCDLRALTGFPFERGKGAFRPEGFATDVFATGGSLGDEVDKPVEV